MTLRVGTNMTFAAAPASTTRAPTASPSEHPHQHQHQWKEPGQTAVVRGSPAVTDGGGLEQREIAAYDSCEHGEQDQQRDRAGYEGKGRRDGAARCEQDGGTSGDTGCAAEGGVEGTARGLAGSAESQCQAAVEGVAPRSIIRAIMPKTTACMAKPEQVKARTRSRKGRLRAIGVRSGVAASGGAGGQGARRVRACAGMVTAARMIASTT